MTTRDIYLEPFASLEVDYLMSLLDEDEATAVDALLRALAEDGRPVMPAVVPPSPAGGPR
jgi:hypothetical protein